MNDTLPLQRPPRPRALTALACVELATALVALAAGAGMLLLARAGPGRLPLLLGVAMLWLGAAFALSAWGLWRLVPSGRSLAFIMALVLLLPWLRQLLPLPLLAVAYGLAALALARYAASWDELLDSGRSSTATLGAMIVLALLVLAVTALVVVPDIFLAFEQLGQSGCLATQWSPA